jgi:hypothetical protein
MLVLDKRYYLNADKTKVVEEGSVEAAYLLGPRGFLISEEDAKKLGLKGLQSADQSVHLQRAERGLPNRVNLDVVQHFPKDAEEVEKVKLTDPNRTALEAVSAQVEARRAEAASEDESTAPDEKEADTEQPRRANRGR